MSEDSLLHQMEALERRLERRLAAGLHPIAETLHRIEQKVDKTNGRVTNLEAYRITTEARSAERSLAAKEAAALVAAQAASTLQAHERSRKWKATVIGLGFTAISVGTPVVSSVLHHFHVL